MQKKVSVIVLAVAVLLGTVGGMAIGAAAVTNKQKQVEAISPKITLTMYDGRGRTETRTYDLTALNYTTGALKATMINPTLYKCGFEP